MYTIVVTDDNRLVTTVKQRVMQRSKLVDDLWFLVKPTYNGYDMGRFTVSLEYMTPISHRYRHEILELSSDLYNDHLKYVLPIDTEITSEAGDIELLLTFLLVDMDENGRTVQRVRKADGSAITVLPVSAWSDVIPDEALSALDQRIIKTDAQIKALNEMGNLYNQNKADNLDYNEDLNELQLTANGKPIGHKITFVGGDSSIKDGVPIVDINNGVPGSSGGNQEGDDIIEF